MMVFILCLVVAGIVFLLCYAAWWWGQTHPKKLDPKFKEKMEIIENKNKIVAHIYNAAKKRKELIPGSESLKIAVIEALNISPEMMRKCLKQLMKEMIIIESADAVGLTTFGVQYHEVFYSTGKAGTNVRKK
jgi:hypothetical protein